MANYDSREFEELDLSNRFPGQSDIAGSEEWDSLIRGIRNLETPVDSQRTSDDHFFEFDRFLQRTSTIRPHLTRPRVFVSHQRLDRAEAERVAWQATEVGFEYWLDVHNPTLALAGRSALPAQIKAFLIAAIIEMGLLNSTHVVSLQTKHSQGSRWVPYEFGRAKQRLLTSWNAASWFEKGIVPDPAGDYLSLAYCAHKESDLEYWFDNQPGARRLRPNMLWTMPNVPKALPN